MKFNDFIQIEIPLPPVAEQRRIVAKIEELFSELDKGVESLKTGREQLKVYRQAVLKHAFEGKLTAKWREENREKLKDFQAPMAEPIPANELTKLPELPTGWLYIRFGHFVETIEAGKSFKCDERRPNPNEIGVAKVSAVTWGEYDESESKTCVDPNKVNPSYFIQEGDFLISRANTIELVGACVIAKRVSQPIMLSDKTLRIKFREGNKAYFLSYLRSMTGRSEIMKRSTGNQESMRNIGQDRIKKIIVPVCSPLEMQEIAERLDDILGQISASEVEISQEISRSEALRQSILKKAFSGQLVPQDPNDEPASVLLERIRAEKTAMAKGGKGRKKAVPC